MLRLETLRHAYGATHAVDQVSLSVGRGEIVCLLGPSGCGKTTLLRLAAGLEPIQQGRVAIDGRLVAGEGLDLPPERRQVGLVFQDYALFPHLGALGNVAFGLNTLPADERRRAALAALERVGMGAQAQAFPHALSGGQQQRVALARALAPSPKVMLMDEPFSGLDSRLRDTVRAETAGLLRASGAAVLLVTHDPEEAMFMADRIALMRQGRLVQLGSPLDLYARPVDAFTARFFGDATEFEVRVEGGRVRLPPFDLPAPGLDACAKALLLVRPEAISLQSGGIPAEVLDAHPIGPASLVELGFGPLRVKARLPGLEPPAVGARVEAGVDTRQVFVFSEDHYRLGKATPRTTGS